jgi:hypothetical protein
MTKSRQIYWKRSSRGVIGRGAWPLAISVSLRHRFCMFNSADLHRLRGIWGYSREYSREARTRCSWWGMSVGQVSNRT